MGAEARLKENSISINDAKEKCMRSMYEVGIIDPVKVTRTALQKASSVATMLLMTGSCIVNEEDK